MVNCSTRYNIKPAARYLSTLVSLKKVSVYFLPKQ